MNDGSFQFTHPQPQWLANDYYHNSGLLQQDNHHHYNHLLQDADAAGDAAPTAVANDAALDNEFEVVKEIDPYDQVRVDNGVKFNQKHPETDKLLIFLLMLFRFHIVNTFLFSFSKFLKTNNKKQIFLKFLTS